MKEKYISLILVASLLMTATIVLGANETPATETIEQRFSFSKPRFTYENELIEIKVEGAASTTHRDGAPKLPVHKTVLEFPMGTRINDVEFAHSPTKSMYVPTKISPSPTPIPLNKMGTQQELPMDETIYNSATYYPEKWFTYKIRVGLNKNNERTTFLTVDVYPVRYSPLNNKIQYITDGTLKVTVNKPANTSDESNTYDLLVISASAYLEELQRLVQHKENHGIKTKLVSADEIHGIGRDKQEQIKHYIKNAIENWGIKYVLLVGGYRSFFGFNKPELQLPIRYVYLNDGGEDGFPSDLYYADIYYYDPVSGYAFDDWDSNGNGRFGEWDWYGYDDLDLIPDVHLGRLACRTIKEAKTMVDKIINYENTYNANENWFKKMLVVTGDDFQDQNMLDIQWNVSLVPDGEYIIHAQTTNCDGVKGTVNEVHVTVDHEATSSVTFSEEDHLTTGRCYPADPVAEITVPSDGDVLGNTDVKNPSPPRAYEGERWTPIQYEKGILHIMGKAYDPQPQADNHPNGPYTTTEVWVTNNVGETVFGPVYADSEMWFEGEWETEKALDYMPNDFEKIRLWTSNGMFHGSTEDPVDGLETVLNQLNNGNGFVYFAGHANPMTWADHYPGIPGGRHNSDVAGLYQINFHMTKPFLPLDTLSNGNKLPVVVLSGCHPSAIDCSLMKLFVDPFDSMYTAKSGIWAPECLSWWLTRVKNGGAIATLGPTALGYGMTGKDCTNGVGGWLWPEFFRQFGEENRDILGEMWTQTLVNYINEFGPLLDQIDAKTVEEMVLLGDPSLKVGGYPSTPGISLSPPRDQLNIKVVPGPVLKSKTSFTSNGFFNGNNYRVTTNPFVDKTPASLISDGNGAFLLGYTRQEQTHSGLVYQDGFAVSQGGVLWKELLMRNGNDEIVHQSVSYAGTSKYAVGTHYLGIGTNFDIILMPDMTNENTWNVLTYYFPNGAILDIGRNGCAISADFFDSSIHYITCFAVDDLVDNVTQVPMFMSSEGEDILLLPGLENIHGLTSGVDHSTHTCFFVFEHETGAYFIAAQYPKGNQPLSLTINGPYPIVNMDVAAKNGKAVVVYEKEGMVHSALSTDGGMSWSLGYIVTTEGKKPEVVANPDGTFDCYFIRDGVIYKTHSNDGENWGTATMVNDVTDLATNDIFDATVGGIVWSATDGDLYAKIFESTSVLTVANIDVTPDKKTITATVVNTGSTDQTSIPWEIKVEGDNPLFMLFGLSLTRGRVWKGGSTTGTIPSLDSGDSAEITSSKIFGIGNIKVTVTAGDAMATEDGFLLGSMILLHYPVE